ncbi:Trigger factor [Stieleria bergensis]|uniref:Trigger factor n=1 Tax=Stieleria bergensis TaxID=2528025 RepID=A0A517SRI9_9BACT|nr:Trigger factor [Planctomycetes bacterium SV_7m_r]
MSSSIETSENTEQTPLQLDVQVQSPEACVREVVVTVPESEVKRYLKEAYDKLVPDAQVPGFRDGRAPRRLVEKQFKDRVAEQVKGQLLMDSLASVTDSEEFSAISEPDFDYNSIPEPGEGAFVFQFKIEVRPEFDTPNWKGMKLEKPVEEITDEKVDEALLRIFRDRLSFQATDDPAALGDRLTVNFTFTQDGKEVGQIEEEQVTLAEALSFADGNCKEFGEKVVGAKEGDDIQVSVELFQEDSEEDAQVVDVNVHVVEVAKLEDLDLTDEVLDELGGFEAEDELKSFIRNSLERQADYRTQQAVRQSVANLLSESVSFDLPSGLVQSQTQRELNRKSLELQRSGFPVDSINSFLNSMRQNVRATTESALREHFILEQIAEDEKVDAEPADYDSEIELIAEQSGESARRVRARLEKTGQMDSLRNQIVERKVIDLVVENGEVTETEAAVEEGQDPNALFAIPQSILKANEESDIPEAKYEDNKPVGADAKTGE